MGGLKEKWQYIFIIITFMNSIQSEQCWRKVGMFEKWMVPSLTCHSCMVRLFVVEVGVYMWKGPPLMVWVSPTVSSRVWMCSLFSYSCCTLQCELKTVCSHPFPKNLKYVTMQRFWWSQEVFNVSSQITAYKKEVHVHISTMLKSTGRSNYKGEADVREMSLLHKINVSTLL